MDNRQRMLLAYKNQTPDKVPVSPELWYDFVLQIDKKANWKEVCTGKYPMWRAQLAAHRYFGSAAWLIAGPKGGNVDGKFFSEQIYNEQGDLEIHSTGISSNGKLSWTVRHNEKFYDWMVEHPIKDLIRDLPAFMDLFMPEPESMDYSDIQNAVDSVGNDGIVTAYAGPLFFNFMAAHLAGGVANSVLSFIDNESLLQELHEKFLRRICLIAEQIIKMTSAQILFLENGYSTAGIISPAIYEKWDLPVIKAVAKIAHDNNRILHLHQHGKCKALLDLIADSGVDLVEPFERPPSGDTPDLSIIKSHYGKKFAIRGNMHSHETLLRGSTADVDREARECIEAAMDNGGFILASGDGVIVGTPFENIEAMVAAAEKYGRY